MAVPVSLTVLAAITEVDVESGRDLALALAGRSLVETISDGRIDMLVPIRRHGAQLTASTDDEAAVRRALVRWADGVLPEEMNVGAADAAWLTDLATLRLAVEAACGAPETRDHGYALANRAFSSLYTAMRLARGRGDPRDRHHQRRRPTRDRRPGRPARGHRGLGGPRQLRGAVAAGARRPARPRGRGSRPRDGAHREHPRRDAPGRGRPRPGRGGGAPRHRARPRHRPHRPAGDPHPGAGTAGAR